MSDTNYDAVSVIEQKHRTLTTDEKERYLQLCRKSISEHIKQATRLSEGEVSKVDVRVETFVVDIDYSFSGDVDVAVCSDRLPPSPEHSVVGTKDELAVRLVSQRDSDLNNTELRRRFENSLTEAIYSEIQEETELYTNPRVCKVFCV